MRDISGKKHSAYPGDKIPDATVSNDRACKVRVEKNMERRSCGYICARQAAIPIMSFFRKKQKIAAGLLWYDTTGFLWPDIAASVAHS